MTPKSPHFLAWGLSEVAARKIDKPQAKKWGDLGVTGQWADQPIRIHSRSDISGTTGFIKQWVAGGAELAKSAQVHETNHD
ncbi:MAG: hypothetical protein ACKN82_01680, partial [Pirellula sp.]